MGNQSLTQTMSRAKGSGVIKRVMFCRVVIFQNTDSRKM